MKGAARKSQQPKRKTKNNTVFQGQQLVAKGQGAYTLKEVAHKVLSMLPRGTFQAAGGALGGAFGGPKGAALGSQIGRGLSIATGYGDYILNDIVHKAGGVPRMDPNTARTISHCEFIADVLAPANASVYNVQRVLQLNPGDDVAFPWLAPIAQRFAKYKFRQLIFEFRSSSSDYAAGTALGTIILAPNYNPIAPAPGSKTAMESLSGAVSAKPSNGIYAGIECANPNPARWVRNPSVNTQTQLTDLADFYIATSGLSAPTGTALGELWVHYTVDLFEPYYAPSQALAQPGAAVLFQPSATTNLFTTGGWGNFGPATGMLFTDLNPDITVASSVILTNGAPPNSRTYLFGIDTSRTRNDTIWFGRVGRYLMTSSMACITPFTVASGDMFAFGGSSSSLLIERIGADIVSTGNDNITMVFRVTVTEANSSLCTVLSTLYTGAATSGRDFCRNVITILE